MLEANNEKQGILVFLDAEKAFHNLNCVFLFTVIKEMNFGDNFIKCIRFIYTSQKAQIIVNKDL